MKAQPAVAGSREMEVLLVEDNPADARLMMEVFKEGDIPNILHVVEDGAEAIDYLHRRPPYESQRTPGIILMDLNLPGKDGHEVLHEIRGDPHLCRIPVIVMTRSSAEEDIERAYGSGASCFITKPESTIEFVSVLKLIRQLWLVTAKLPTPIPRSM